VLGASGLTGPRQWGTAYGAYDTGEKQDSIMGFESTLQRHDRCVWRFRALRVG